jgi:uncharacterized protein (DUF302 family)
MVLKEKGVKVFLRLDQTAEAIAVGLTLRPTVLIIFGDPQTGTPLMNLHPSLALDLPLKALIWQSEDGKLWLSYNSPEFLEKRHGLPTPPFHPVETLLQAVAK